MSKRIRSSEEQVADGQHAKALMQDPLVQDQFAALEGKYVDLWRAGTTTEEREAVWHRLQALEDLKTQLRITVSNGQLAARNSATPTR